MVDIGIERQELIITIELELLIILPHLLLQHQKKTKKISVKKKQVLMKEDEIYTRLLWLGFSGENAVKNFQEANNLIPDGIAGPKTIELLKNLTKYY